MNLSAKSIEACARAAHEVNRAYCIAIGDDSQSTWEHAPKWQRDMITTIGQKIDGALLGQDEGGALFVGTKKMVPYASLPPAQRAKDALFLAVVRATAEALRAS